MKKILLFLFLFPILSMSQGIMGDKTEFSRQDTLRGSITKERSWWDLNRYHLDIRVNPDEKFISGSNKNLNNLQVSKELINISKSTTTIGKKVKILFVKDRPGHDVRYALNSNKIKKKLGWKPRTNFRQGIKLTFDWYFKNKNYYKSISKKDIIKRLGIK